MDQTPESRPQHNGGEGPFPSGRPELRRAAREVAVTPEQLQSSIDALTVRSVKPGHVWEVVGYAEDRPDKFGHFAIEYDGGRWDTRLRGEGIASRINPGDLVVIRHGIRRIRTDYQIGDAGLVSVSTPADGDEMDGGVFALVSGKCRVLPAENGRDQQQDEAEPGREYRRFIVSFRGGQQFVYADAAAEGISHLEDGCRVVFRGQPMERVDRQTGAVSWRFRGWELLDYETPSPF